MILRDWLVDFCIWRMEAADERRALFWHGMGCWVLSW